MPQIIFILGILIYRFFLDNVYIQTIAPFYAYQGLDYVGTNICLLYTSIYCYFKQQLNSLILIPSEIHD